MSPISLIEDQTFEISIQHTFIFDTVNFSINTAQSVKYYGTAVKFYIAELITDLVSSKISHKFFKILKFTQPKFLILDKL